MRSLKVLIVDDEPLALDRLADLLSQIDGVELVGRTLTGSEALSAIAKVNPDLVLLDIEMPKMDGFDVVESLVRLHRDEEDAPPPLIGFVTAYPQFALTAFDTGALDFLCKPVRVTRLEKTVERARKALAQREASLRLRELSEQLEDLREARLVSEDQSLWVHRRGEMVRLNISDLDWVEAQGEYVKLHFGERAFLLRSSITAFCERLPVGEFVRIHRSAVINRGRLSAVRTTRSGAKVVLDSGIELPVGRKFRRALQSAVPSPV
jgi:DNA-binding LytR/AlgR family response regulator